MNYKYDVFLSYSRKNLDKIELIYERLVQGGLKVWFDRELIVGGDKWRKTITEAIIQSKLFVVVFSSELYENSNSYVYQEVEIAINSISDRKYQEYFIIPLRLDNVSPYKELTEYHHIDLFPNFEKGVLNIFKLINTKPIYTSNHEIIGFDLGHGETSIAKSKLFSNIEPQIVEIIPGKKSIITAIAQHPNKGILVGEDAFCENSTTFNIMFKSNDFNRKDIKDNMQLFIRQCIKNITDNNQIDFNDETIFYVGCPSGWSDKDLLSYENLIKEVGIKNVKIIPESRAAFLDAKESGVLKSSYNKHVDSVLIIDIGSSTTDFTIVKDFNETPINDDGNNTLGGAIIDVLLFNFIFSEYPEAIDFLNKNPKEKAQIILKCRKIKEEYFSKESSSFDYIKDTIDIESIDLFIRVKISKSDMSNILNQNNKQLNNLSWYCAFKKELEKCKTDKNFNNPSLIIITGGASRMQFLQLICKEVFPNSIIKVGLEPSLTVARGLALAGRIDFQIKAFKEEVFDFVYSDKLKINIEKTLPIFHDSITKSFLDKLIIPIYIENLNKWHNGVYETFDEFEKAAIKKIASTYKNSFFVIFNEEILNFKKKLDMAIDEDAIIICDKYKIPRTSLNLEINSIGMNLDYKFNISRDFFSSLGGILAIIVFLPFVLLTAFWDWLMGTKVTNDFTEGIDKFAENQDQEFRKTKFPLSERISKLSISKCKEKILSNRTEFEKKIKEEIQKSFQSEFIDNLVKQVKEMLIKKSEEASFYIKRKEN